MAKLLAYIYAAKRSAIACLAACCFALAGCQSLAPTDSRALSDTLADSIRTMASADAGERERLQAAAVVRQRMSATFEARLAEAASPGLSQTASPDPTPGSLPQGDAPDSLGGVIADPADFARIDPVRRPRETRPGLHRAGIGLPAVGRLSPEGDPNAPRAGYKLPLTLVSLPGAAPGACCESALLDPRQVAGLRTGYGDLPVAMDLETPLRTADATGPRLGSGVANLVRPGLFAGQPRIQFLEPFDPDRRPLVLVHGLLSTKRVWTPLVLDLMADPVIREHFQIWFFHYPTGQPVPLSALQLREALDDVAERWRPRYPIVLAGHSMGGILARAQVSRIGPEQADAALPGVAQLPPESRVRRALIFEPRTDVSRAVFMLVPHRGSRLASSGLGAWGVRLIRLPGTLVDEIAAGLDQLTGTDIPRTPTSIDGLSPNSRFLRVLDATRPTVPVHSIIGDRGRNNGWAGSDGVVPYASSHLRFAESEVIVPAGHGGFDHPDAVAELKRILHLELAGEDTARR